MTSLWLATGAALPLVIVGLLIVRRFYSRIHPLEVGLVVLLWVRLCGSTVPEAAASLARILAAPQPHHTPRVLRDTRGAHPDAVREN